MRLLRRFKRDQEPHPPARDERKDQYGWSAGLKFGPVEVRAKLPIGDWLWPVDGARRECVRRVAVVWRLPPSTQTKSTSWRHTGTGPAIRSRASTTSDRCSTGAPRRLFLNALCGWARERCSRYDDEFHTHALEWNEQFITLALGYKRGWTPLLAFALPSCSSDGTISLRHMLEPKLSKSSLWDRGDLPTVVQNGSEGVMLANVWVNGTKAAPFDQPFYLTLNVAVGGTNGWLPDGPEKP
ncbi:hypothetical protein C8R43DRAFT_1193313 [Mycena crocata]|nr:hypothetical protein C8R43DRAFT_1193313 [Mycena crocata]